MKHILPLETRSAEPIEIRNEGEPDLATAITAVTELRTAVETNRTALDTRLTTELRGLTERLDAIDVRTQRPGQQQEQNTAGEPERRAFFNFVRRGREGLPAEEVRMLRVADDTAGGYLAPEQFIAEILRNLVQFSPVRAAARVGTMSAASLKIPKRTGSITAGWVGEIELRPATQPAYGQIDLVAHEMACFVDVSNQLLEDAIFDLASELSFDFAEEFGRLEGQAFVLGNGAKKPFGVLVDPTIPTVISGSATTITSDALINLAYSLPTVYRGRGAWMMNSTTLGTLRKLKDGQGNYIWQRALTDGQPDTLLGYPIIEAVDMPDPAAGTAPILFGDFNTAYRIYDRVGLSVLRDPYTIAVYGQTRFHARKRVAADVVKAEALRKMIVSAT